MLFLNKKKKTFRYHRNVYTPITSKINQQHLIRRKYQNRLEGIYKKEDFLRI